MSLQVLRQILSSEKSGAIASPNPLNEVVKLLSDCWNDLDGSEQEGMAPKKITVDRLENVTWNSPLLEFTIERHGPTVKGSSRGSLSHWKVDLESQTATFRAVGFRQLRKMDQKWDAKAEAARLADLIRRGMEDDGLRWTSPDRVRILIGEMVPGNNKQTLEGLA